MIYIAVMGYGVVGSGAVEVFYKNYESLVSKVGQEMEIKHILDLRNFEDSPYKEKFTKDFDEIISDPDIKIVVEAMGGLHPALEYTSQCLSKGISVITSNKELVAEKGAELLSLAKENNANYLFEASVGGGIPIIRPITQCLAANDIDEIIGILNGTTNFILTKMIRDKMTFADALALAGELGYAERDSSADVDGHDACRKICILASLAFGHQVYPYQVFTEGIRDISLADVEYAEACNCAIKLIGRVKRLDNRKLTATVYPALVSHENQLSSVSDVFNAIVVRGDATGDVLFYGKGAGKLPTASAVVADVIDAALHLKTRKNLYWDDGTPDYVTDHMNDIVSLYVRAYAEDREYATGQLQGIFPRSEILRCKEPTGNEIAFVTPAAPEKELREKLSSLDGINILSTIHMLD